MNTTSKVNRSMFLLKQPSLFRSLPRSRTQASNPGRVEERYLLFPSKPKDMAPFWRRTRAPEQKIMDLMSKMKMLTATPLASYSHEWTVVPQRIVPIEATKAAAVHAGRNGQDPRRVISFSRFLESKSKVSTITASMCSILGRILRGASTSTPCKCTPSISISIRSRILNSKSSWTLLTITRRTT